MEETLVGAPWAGWLAGIALTTGGLARSDDWQTAASDDVVDDDDDDDGPAANLFYTHQYMHTRSLARRTFKRAPVTGRSALAGPAVRPSVRPSVRPAD